MADLQCVICLFIGQPPEKPDRDEDDPPRDGLAVTVVGGNAACEWHVNVLMPADVQIVIGHLGKEMRARNMAAEGNDR